MTRTSPIALAIAGLLLAAVARPAAAQSFALREGFSTDPSKVVTSARVPYSDLDIASSEGARALLQRIGEAADAVCGGAAPRASVREAEAFLDCRAAAVSGAVAQARSPALAALIARRRTEARAAR